VLDYVSRRESGVWCSPVGLQIHTGRVGSRLARRNGGLLFLRQMLAGAVPRPAPGPGQRCMLVVHVLRVQQYITEFS
jgi:hypothetical protein